MRRLAAALAVALCPAAPAQAEVPARNMILDDFETASPWTLIASDDVKATLRPVDGTATLTEFPQPFARTIAAQVPRT